MSVAEVLPGDALELSDDERTRLGGFLQELGTDLEQQHSVLLRNIDTWWDWVEANPKQKIRTDPFPGASNIVIPLIGMHSDAIKARFQNVIFGAPDLWTSRTRNEAYELISKNSTDFLNWAANDNEFDILTPSSLWFDEAVPIGSSILMLNWTSRRRQVFVPGEGGKPKPMSVELGRGPMLSHIPREQVLWQPGRSINDSEYVYVQSWKTIGDLIALEQLEGIDKGLLETVRPCDGSSSYSAEMMRRKLQGGGITSDASEFYDIRQVWIEQPTLRGMKFERLGQQDLKTPSIPLCITYDHSSGTVLRAMAKPYYTRSWPFYECQFRSSARGPNSGGVARRLEQLQRGVTTMANQAMDAVTMANSVTMLTTDRRFQTQRFTPGRPIFVDQLDTVREVVLPKQITPDIALVNMMMAMAERITGINDPSLGRELRYGGHPSPATSTALMLQESKEMFRASIRHIRLQYGRMAEDILTLYQQYESGTSGKIERALGAEDGASAKEWLVPQGPIAGNIEFDLMAVTENLNPEAEREKAIFTLQATASYYGQVMQALQVAAHPNSPPPVKAAATKSIEALTAGFEKVLTAAQVDDVKQFVLQLKETNFGPETVRQVGNAITGELGGVAAARGQRPLPAYATGPDGLPVAPNGAPTGTGF